MTTATKEPQEMSTQELAELLAKRKKEEQAQRQKEKAKYEKEKEHTVQMLFKHLWPAVEACKTLKELCHDEMESMHERLLNYGMLRGNSLGGFSLTSTCGNFRVKRTRDTKPQWDERGEKGLKLVHDFLYDKVKRRDKKLFTMLMSFLERNKAGDLEYSRVMSLIQYEGTYQDERWQEGLRLIKESYQVHLQGYGYLFQRKDEHGKWQTININFSSL